MARKLAAIVAVLGLLATLLSLGAWRNHAVPRANEVKEIRAPARKNGRRSIAKKLLATIAVLALLVAVISISVLALFTDTASVPANTFTTGTVDISTTPTTALVTFTSPPMAPGDQVTAPVTVSNDGTLELRYAITSTTTEDTLAAELDLTIKSGVTTCDDAGFGVDGTVLYGPDDLGVTTTINVVGDPTSGGDAGDRTLAASTNEDLCFNVALPLSATNAAQDLTTTATFAFEAEQTKNNP